MNDVDKKQTARRVVSTVVGFLMLAVSTPCVAAMLNDIFIERASDLTGALIIGIFMAFVGVGGVALMWLGIRKPQERPLEISQELERRALEVAKQHGGRLTVTELAVGTDLSLDESRMILEHLEQREAVRTHLSEEGHIVYVVPGFTVDKASAIDPLNDAAMFDAALGSVDEQEDEVVLEQPEEATQEGW